MREKSRPPRIRTALRSFYMPWADVSAPVAWHNAPLRDRPVDLNPESTIAEQRMALAIRDVREHDLDAVLALNNAAGRSILALDANQLRYFYEHADYFRVAEIDDHLAGFLIALREGHDYNSPNYRWFAAHYPQFVYIDAETRVPLLTCEVFLEPRDDVVVLFHGTYGFQEVAQQKMGAEGPQVSLLAKELPSYAYVRDTWLDRGGLPDVRWLAERADAPAADAAQRRLAGERRL